MNTISNAQVKHIRLLQQKKYRQKYRQFVVEGGKSVLEFLHSGYKSRLIIVTHAWFEENENTSLPEKLLCSNEQFHKISALKNPQGILAVFEIPKDETPDFNAKMVLYLDDIRDPGNLGTIIRTADWFGFTQIFCSTTSVDCFNPKVVQASMGSLAHTSIFYCEIDELIREKYNLLLADLDGEDYATFKSKEKTALIIGNEAKGVNDQIKNLPHTSITIPKKGKAESLNAAMSTGILLSQLVDS